MKKTAKNIVTNPIILGIAAGLLWSVLRIPKPVILQKTVQNMAVLATPLGLIAMGASFEAKSAAKNIRPSIAAAAIKLVGLAAVLSADRRDTWLPSGKIGGNPCDAGFRNDGEQFYHGEKYGS